MISYSMTNDRRPQQDERARCKFARCPNAALLRERDEQLAERNSEAYSDLEEALAREQQRRGHAEQQLAALETRLRDTEALTFALQEDRGKLIVALYEMPLAQLEALVDAAQLIDSEGQEAMQAREQESARFDFGGAAS